MVQVRTAVDTMEAISTLGSVFNRDPDHSARVTELSLAIFDELYPLHRYGQSERRLLEMAGIMHDIGYSQPDQKPHNKTSRDLILNMDIPGVDPLDKLTFALVARYHTGELPDADEHRHFSDLSEKRREVVEWLAGILRVADALDCKHLGIVKKLDVELEDRQIIFSLDIDGDCRKQIRRAREKEDLLVKITGKEIQYRC